MKSFLIFISVCLFTVSVFSQTFCLRLIEESNDEVNLIVRLDIQGSEEFDLGSSNLQFSYNSASLGIPSLESSPLAPPFYLVPTVTNPEVGEVSFNIELGFPGFGTTISAPPDWTELGQINFPITDPLNIGEMVWSYNGGTTQTVVFLDDEETQIFATNISCLEPLIIVPLPVELMSFSAIKQAGVGILDWVTSSETNNKGFEVLRSNDAKSWEKIGWVEGNRTTALLHEYNYRDEAPLVGKNYYRLKQIDFDGKYEYTEIRELSFDKEKSIVLFPNPTRGHINILLPVGETEADIQIYDENGKLVYKEVVDGNSFSVNNLVAGNYFVIVTIGQEQYEEKLTVSK